MRWASPDNLQQIWSRVASLFRGPQQTLIACSRCFRDQGLQLDASHFGVEDEESCPNCGQYGGRKLDRQRLGALAHRFFVWGSLYRSEYGGTPLIQFNEHNKTTISPPEWLKGDIQIFERFLGVGFFHYGPRLWMIGEIEPLKALQNPETRLACINRIIAAYPHTVVDTTRTFYRIRKNLESPSDNAQYDAPPSHIAGKGRLDAHGFPVLYASADLELCVHECRVTAEDELYVATLAPRRELRLLDLTAVLDEDLTEFESMDMAVNMLFLAGAHSYDISRALARSAQSAGYDGLVYPSYFSLLRLGAMPFETAYGLSLRRFSSQREYEQAKALPNMALFGRPIKDGYLEVRCINKLIINRVGYSFHFGPADF